MMVQLRNGIRSVYRSPGRVCLCFCIGVSLQTMQIAINVPLAQVSGLRIPFYAWLYAWPLAKLSSLLPVTQGGIGVREVALVGLLAPLGAPPVLTAAVGLVFEAITIVGGLIAGIIAFVIGRIHSARPGPRERISTFAKDEEPTLNG